MFSGVTVFRGPRRTIVFNDAHAPGRQANDIGHELSHGLLLHTPTHSNRWPRLPCVEWRSRGRGELAKWCSTYPRRSRDSDRSAWMVDA